jgi:polyhydroxybutyrate depolymerase
MKKPLALILALVTILSFTFTLSKIQPDLPAKQATSFFAGGDRSTFVDVPIGYTSRHPASLLIDLHGYMSNSINEQRFAGLRNLAREQGFIYTSPDGLRDSNGDQSWNASKACCSYDNPKFDDAAFLKSLIVEISQTVAINPKQIYIFGHSNGAFMAYKFACTYPEFVAAIIAVAGAMDLGGSECATNSPVSVLEVHGTDDEIVLFNGGAMGENKYTSVLQTVNFWRAIDKCSDPADVGDAMDAEEVLTGSETTTSNSQCGNTSVTSWQINGGNHRPIFTSTFKQEAFEWLLSHPKR